MSKVQPPLLHLHGRSPTLYPIRKRFLVEPPDQRARPMEGKKSAAPRLGVKKVSEERFGSCACVQERERADRRVQHVWKARGVLLYLQPRTASYIQTSVSLNSRPQLYARLATLDQLQGMLELRKAPQQTNTRTRPSRVLQRTKRERSQSKNRDRAIPNRTLENVRVSKHSQQSMPHKLQAKRIRAHQAMIRSRSLRTRGQHRAHKAI